MIEQTILNYMKSATSPDGRYAPVSETNLIQRYANQHTAKEIGDAIDSLLASKKIEQFGQSYRAVS